MRRAPAARPSPLWSTRSGRTVPVVVILAGLALGISACGGGSPQASSSTPTTSEATSSGSSSSSASSAMATPLKYAECMRSHGVTAYPDPTAGANGGVAPVKYGPGTGINPNSPTLQAASHACLKYAPAGNPASGQGAQAVNLLKFAECMRAHGVTNFPDPSASGNLLIPQSIDTQTPTFQAASQACQRYMPGAP